MYEDLPLCCWSCRAPLEAGAVRQDGVLVPRAREEGGPYWSYRCPTCHADMHCEQNLFCKLLVTPPPIFPLFDALVSFFDEAQWRDYQARRRWFDERDGLREWFFGAYEDQLAEEAAREAGQQARRREGVADRARSRARERARNRRRADEGPRPGPDERARAEEPPRPRVEVDRPSPPNEILGVEPGATADELSKAYRDLAKKYHPDRFAHLDDEFQKLAHRRFLEIRSAYDALHAQAGA